MISDASVFYHIYPLGALDALRAPRDGSPRLRALSDWIPHLLGLGVNAVYLGPVFESTWHGYDTVDYGKVDARLGTNADLRALVADFHAAGIDVVLDAVLNHSGRDFWAFRDLRERGRESAYASWYRGMDFSVHGPRGDGFGYEGWAGNHDLVKFDLGRSEVRDFLSRSAESWIAEYGIDGLRLDAADVMDRGFLRELALRCRAGKPGFWLMGEMVAGDYRDLLDAGGLDSVTNYECYKGLWSSCNDHNYHEIAWSLERQFGAAGIYRGRRLYSFADNHDVDRVASALRDAADAFPLHCLLFTMPGLPSVYYGSERLVAGRRTASSDEELRKPFSPSVSGGHVLGRDLEAAIARLAALRKRLVPLLRGDYAQVDVGAEKLAFSRSAGGSRAVVAVNGAPKADRVRSGFAGGARVRDELNGESMTIARDGTVEVPPKWCRVLVAA